jgi:hypothetical protein
MVLIGSLLLLHLPLPGGPTSALASTAGVLRVGAVPPEPTTCDSVTIEVVGALTSSCLEIVGAEIQGPLPPNPLCMGPICPSRFEIHITVREPGLPTPCPANLVPYKRSFPVGILAAGAYSVRAVEVLLPSDATVSGAVDSSAVSTLFFVRESSTCPPGPGCYILDFGPSRPLPVPEFCTTVAPPGGSAEFDLLLHNQSPVAGVQVAVGVFDPRLDPGPNGPLPGGTFTPKSVVAVGRAQGLQVEWTATASVLKAILFSADGAWIPSGGGPILRIVYDVSSDTRPGSYFLGHFDEVVSDPEGNALQPCLTIRDTSGRLCVVVPGCDVNGDGSSDVRDIIHIVRCALAGAGTEACPDSIAARADCTGDGRIDVRDVICCVRKVLAVRLGSVGPVIGIPPPVAGVTLNFVGDVDWVTPVDGRARMRFSPEGAAAGAEWMIRLSPDHARAHDLRIVSGGEGVHVEWSADQAGHVSAMLYSENGGTIGHDVVLELALDRVLGSSGASTVQITDPLAAESDGSAQVIGSSKWSASMSATGVPAPAVYGVRPNPFASESEITFALPSAARAEIRIYDVRGRLVRTLVNEPCPAGVYHEPWDGRSDDGRAVASGVYLLRFRAGGVTQTQRLLRLR